MNIVDIIKANKEGQKLYYFNNGVIKTIYPKKLKHVLLVADFIVLDGFNISCEVISEDKALAIKAYYEPKINQYKTEIEKLQKECEHWLATITEKDYE